MRVESENRGTVAEKSYDFAVAIVLSQSKPDFLSKMNIALKEANETLYWIDLLFDTDYIPIGKKQRYHKECNELVSLLSAIVKTTKMNLGAKYAK